MAVVGLDPSQCWNFELFWGSSIGPYEKFELFIPQWLENRVIFFFLADTLLSHIRDGHRVLSGDIVWPLPESLDGIMPNIDHGSIMGSATRGFLVL